MTIKNPKYRPTVEGLTTLSWTAKLIIGFPVRMTGETENLMI
jgi:hypothetical protein